MFVLGHREGHVVVWQRAHAEMCGQPARAWGNDAFGGIELRFHASRVHEQALDAYTARRAALEREGLR